MNDLTRWEYDATTETYQYTGPDGTTLIVSSKGWTVIDSQTPEVDVRSDEAPLDQWIQDHRNV